MIEPRFLLMKKYICLLAGAALLVACEQKTETVAPASSPVSSPEATVADTSTPPSAAGSGDTTLATPTPTP